MVSVPVKPLRVRTPAVGVPGVAGIAGVLGVAGIALPRYGL